MTVTVGRASVGNLLPFPVSPAGVRLYCLPHAGGSASAFRPWVGRLAGVAVCPVQPAGRETRLRDVPPENMAALVAELTDFVLADTDGPYAVFGHSLGALVGFELVHEIQRRGGPPPVGLLVSGCAAPQTLDPKENVDGLSDAEIVSLLRTLGGTPEVFLSDPRALRLILPPVRADLTVRNSYRYQPRPPLNVPITAIASTDDARASVESMTAWREQTVRRFHTRLLTGGHFAILEQSDTVLRYFDETLRPWSRPGATS